MLMVPTTRRCFAAGCGAQRWFESGGGSVQVHLVVFEAWNISRFIFVTNKRREIAGASELITYLERTWVRTAVEGLFPGFEARWRMETEPVEILETGAGTAKVLVRDQTSARNLVRAVTTAALREAPGLEVCGVVGEPFDWSAEGALHASLGRTAERLAPVRTALPGPDARFMRLPVVAGCASTGLPAESMVRLPDGSEPRSAESRAKWRAYGRQTEGDGLKRLAKLAGVTTRELAQVVDHLNDHAEWVGVVYADGNGLGSVFGNFEACVEGRSNRQYADTLRTFSAALQSCARDAFADAVHALEGLGARLEHGPVPLLPLILGGDDLVALCSGDWALPFTEAYLRAFEKRTATTSDLVGPLSRQGKRGLSACAGVAIVKPHFPFSASRDLAYDLMHEAKHVKNAVEGRCSALSFHVLYDSSEADLNRIRARGTGPDAARLSAQPYVVSDVAEECEWTRGRRWGDLTRRVTALAARDDEGERHLPASQLHDLRQALFLGRSVADARFGSLLPRYPDLEQLDEGQGSLFWRETGSGSEITGFLDALDAAAFLVEGRTP